VTANSYKETKSYIRGFCCTSGKDRIYLSWLRKK